MKRSVRLLSLLAATLLLLAACSTAEEAGEATATEGGGDTAVEEASSEPSTVISEPGLEETSEPAAGDTDTDTSGDSGDLAGDTLAAVAADNPQLSQLVTALDTAGLTSALEEAGPLTVFAPNNDAFASVDQATLTQLLANPSDLQGVLQYHVVEGSYPSSELSDGDTLTTLSGDELTVSIDGDSVMVGEATVVQPDLQAGNGTLHVIDTVLQP